MPGGIGVLESSGGRGEVARGVGKGGEQREKRFSNGYSSACAARRDAAPRGEKVRGSDLVLVSVSSRARSLVDVAVSLFSRVPSSPFSPSSFFLKKSLPLLFVSLLLVTER